MIQRDKFVKIFVYRLAVELYRHLVCSRFVTGQKKAIAAAASNLVKKVPCQLAYACSYRSKTWREKFYGTNQARTKNK
jgi:hypothetical protein